MARHDSNRDPAHVSRAAHRIGGALFVIGFLVALLVALSGCGDDEELTTFRLEEPTRVACDLTWYGDRDDLAPGAAGETPGTVSVGDGVRPAVGGAAGPELAALIHRWGQRSPRPAVLTASAEYDAVGTALTPQDRFNKMVAACRSAGWNPGGIS